MYLSLVKLLNLNETPDVKTAHANFYRHVPSIAPYAYLHTIYAPGSLEAISSFSVGLEIPGDWMSFLLIQNGADLFSNALFLYGVNDPKQLKDRSSNYSQAAFPLQEVNQQRVLARFPDYLQIGSYGYNAARLLLSRRDESIELVSRSGEEILAKWASLENYFREEFGRLASLYSDSGVLLANKKSTVPGGEFLSQ